MTHDASRLLSVSLPPVLPSDPPPSCAICLEPIDEDSGPSYANRCLHCFCFMCIRLWIHRRSQCPLCRTELDYVCYNVRSPIEYDFFELAPISTAKSYGCPINADYWSISDDHPTESLNYLQKDQMDSSPNHRELSEHDQARARIQEELKAKLVCDDTESWIDDLTACRYIAGLDVSYEKDSDKTCAALVIFDTEKWTTIYKDLKFGHVTTDYAAGFLAFREIDFLMGLVDSFKNKPEYADIEPHVWLIDGNGIMHPRGLGLASHFGVLIDRPTIGVSKNPYFFTDGQQVDRKQYKADLESALVKRGDRFDILGLDGTPVGVALKTQDAIKNPVYVSIGHRVSLETAIKVTLKCCRDFKNPEPVRQADMVSREALRKASPPDSGLYMVSPLRASYRLLYQVTYLPPQCHYVLRYSHQSGALFMLPSELPRVIRRLENAGIRQFYPHLASHDAFMATHPRH